VWHFSPFNPNKTWNWTSWSALQNVSTLLKKTPNLGKETRRHCLLGRGKAPKAGSTLCGGAIGSQARVGNKFSEGPMWTPAEWSTYGLPRDSTTTRLIYISALNLLLMLMTWCKLGVHHMRVWHTRVVLLQKFHWTKYLVKNIPEISKLYITAVKENSQRGSQSIYCKWKYDLKMERHRWACFLHPAQREQRSFCSQPQALKG
jgi:hypothetical protein